MVMPKPRAARNIYEFIDELSGVDTVAALRGAFSRTLESFGMDWFTYGGMRLPRTGRSDPVIITTYPDEWARHYAENAYQNVDAVVRSGMQNMLPFQWDTLPMQPRQKKIMNEATEFGVISGLSVPIHGPAGEFALLSIASELPPPEFEKVLRESRHHMHVMSLYYHAMVQDLFTPEQAAETVQLSPREAEVLSWTSEGKTA